MGVYSSWRSSDRSTLAVHVDVPEGDLVRREDLLLLRHHLADELLRGLELPPCGGEGDASAFVEPPPPPPPYASEGRDEALGFDFAAPPATFLPKARLSSSGWGMDDAADNTEAVTAAEAASDGAHLEAAALPAAPMTLPTMTTRVSGWGAGPQASSSGVATAASRGARVISEELTRWR